MLSYLKLIFIFEFLTKVLFSQQERKYHRYKHTKRQPVHLCASLSKTDKCQFRHIILPTHSFHHEFSNNVRGEVFLPNSRLNTYWCTHI